MLLRVAKGCRSEACMDVVLVDAVLNSVVGIRPMSKLYGSLYGTTAGKEHFYSCRAGEWQYITSSSVAWARRPAPCLSANSWQC